MKYKIFIACLIGALTITTKTYALKPGSEAGFDGIITKFINSIINSDPRLLDEVLAKDLRFKIPHGDHLMVFGKAEVVDDMKSRHGFQQHYEPAYTVLTKSDVVAIVRIDFNYEDTVMENVITIEKNAEQGWKVTQVYELFETTDPQLTVSFDRW